MIISLEPWEYEWATMVGVRRFTANWNKKDARHYDATRMEDNRTAQVAACCCEIAVAKATNRFWSGTVWSAENHDKEKHRPDVGTNIEVRRVRTKNAVAVREHQVGKGLILFGAKAIEPEFRQVDVLGWIDYDTAWALGEPSDFHATRYLSLGELTPLT